MYYLFICLFIQIHGYALNNIYSNNILLSSISQPCFLEVCFLSLFHNRFPSPTPVPRGLSSNQCSFDGEVVQGEAQGIMSETAGALLAASLFPKPA